VVLVGVFAPRVNGLHMIHNNRLGYLGEKSMILDNKLWGLVGQLERCHILS
jgi:hypothetical protein